MFTRTDAERLRATLPTMEFRPETTEHTLLQAYRDHYGLNLSSQEQPVQHAVGTLPGAGFELVCHYFSIPLAGQKGTAFLLHGYFDHTGIYGHLIRHCLRQGYAVVIFDLPGHGLSSGNAASIDSFRQYSAALLDCLELAEKQSVHQPWVAIGQSTGAAVLMDAMLDGDLASRFQFEQVILLGPLLRPGNWMFSKMLFQFSRWFLRSTPRTFAINSHDLEFVDFVRRNDGLQSQRLPRDWVLAMIDYQKRFARAGRHERRLHVIQGSADTTVDWQYNLPRIETKFPGTRTYMISGARHHLVNEAPEFRDRVFTIIDQILEL